MEASPSFLLRQVADSAFPIGGYAYSYGLEASFQRGMVVNGRDFYSYAQSFLRNQAFGELPFVNSSFDINPMAFGEELEQLHWRYDATVLSGSMGHAGLSMGNNWLRTLIKIFPEGRFNALKNWLVQKRVPAHYVPLFGWCLAELGIERKEAQSLFLYQSLRDQVSAAVRLGIIGPLEGAALQNQLGPFAADLLTEAVAMKCEGAFRESPQIELSQSAHEHLYSRIFQC